MPLVSPNNDLILAGIQDDILAVCALPPVARLPFGTAHGQPSSRRTGPAHHHSHYDCGAAHESPVTPVHPSAQLHRPSTSEGAGGCHHRLPNSTHACTSPTPQTNLRMTVPPATTVPPVPPS